jgi:hypothetical protein
VLASLFATFAIAMARFGESLWLDEASSIWFARQPVMELLLARCDPNPPGYYLLLKAWLFLSENEVWLRLPSLFGAVLAVCLIYQLGLHATAWRHPKESVLQPALPPTEATQNHKTELRAVFAILAALLLALHPLQSWYASEVRMYALVQCAGLAMVWFGLRLLAVPSARKIGMREILPYWLLATLALLLGYSALLPWGLLQLFWVGFGRPRAWLWLSIQLAILLPLAALSLTPGQSQTLGQVHYSIFVSIQAARLGFYLTPPMAKWLLLSGVLVVISVSLLLALDWRRLNRPLDRPWVRLLVIGAWLMLLVVAAVPRALTLKRYLVVVLPYMALVTAYPLCRSRRKIQGAILGLGLFATLVSVATYQREPWRTVIADLVRADDGTPKVMWVDDTAVPNFDYYIRQDQRVAEMLKWAPLYSHDLPRLPELTPEPGDELWFVTAENRYRRPVALLPAAFYEQYELAGERHETGIGAYRFRRRLQPIPGAPAPFIRTQVDDWGILLPSPVGQCDRQ